MKSSKYMRRFYRDWAKAKDLHSAHVVARETDLQVFTNKPLNVNFVEERIRAYRWDIENYISRDHRFLTALKPLAVEINAPFIIKDMAEQSKMANVGPMSTVAGAIAQCIGLDLIKEGYNDVIIENGGDVFLKTRRIRKVGVYVGRSKLGNNLELLIKPKDTPMGICTSSGTLGHSLSFGCADSVVILSKNTALADAVATSTANRINSKYDLQKALEFSRSVKGVLGVVIILKNNLLTWGKIEFDK